MHYKDVMKKYHPHIDAALEQFFNLHLNRVKHLPGIASQSLEVLKEFSLRKGKRIRPILAIVAYRGYGGENMRSMIRASISLELIHNFLLIHDDVMDRDDQRRGKPTVHKIYSKQLKHHENAHYGLCQAVNSGDLCYALAQEALHTSGFGAEKTLSTQQNLARVMVNTTIGQMLDVQGDYRMLDVEEVNAVHMLKTAIYSFVGPLQTGAILAGANRKRIDSLSNVAIPLGIAFQLRDDILGVFGDQKKIGKSVGSDVKEGKTTLLVTKALEMSKPTEKAFLTKCLGNQKLTSTQLKRFRKIIIDSGSLDHSRLLISRYITEAKRSISRTGLDSEAVSTLASVADYIASRDR